MINVDTPICWATWQGPYRDEGGLIVALFPEDLRKIGDRMMRQCRKICDRPDSDWETVPSIGQIWTDERVSDLGLTTDEIASCLASLYLTGRWYR